MQALKIKPFRVVYFAHTAYGQITEDKVLLLSKESELKMVAELIPLDRTQECPENKLNFDLQQTLSSKHQIKLMFADQKKGHAYFFSQSYHDPSNNQDEVFLIDCVHFLKFAVDA